MKLVSCFVPIYMPVLFYFVFMFLFSFLFGWFCFFSCLGILPVVEVGVLVTLNPALCFRVDTVAY